MNFIAARLNVETTAKRLGFQAHDIPVLIKAKLLKPLGNPMPSSPKYFASCLIEELARDVAWLDKATRAVSRHWKCKNQQRKTL